MWTARRKFLARFGAAFLGSAAFLQPTQLFAFGRRRGGNCCCPPPPVCFAPPECISPPVVHLAHPIPTLTLPKFTYPLTTTTTISLDGDFVCWGGCGTIPVGNIGVKIVNADNSNYTGAPAGTKISGLGSDFCVGFSKFTATGFYLAITNQGTIISSAGEYGPFTTGVGG